MWERSKGSNWGQTIHTQWLHWWLYCDFWSTKTIIPWSYFTFYIRQQHTFSHSASNCDVSVLIYCPPWCSCWCPQTAARGSVCHWGPQSLWDQGQMARGWRRATEHWAAPPEIRRSHHPAAPMSPESKHRRQVWNRCVQYSVCIIMCVFLNYRHCWKALWQHVKVCTFLRSERWQQHCRRRSSKDRMWTVLDTCLACWELDRAGSAWDKPNSWATGETERVNTILNHHYCY